MSALPATQHDEDIRQALEARIASGSLELPLLPDAVMQILNLCQSPDSSASALSAAIHRDPALAGHIIRVSNSPAYYPGTPIVSLQQAIGRLGQRAIAEIAVLISVKGSVLNLPAFAPEMAALWKHAAAAGAWAREIARQRRRPVDAALLCGLLQNVGVPVILKALAGLAKEIGTTLEKSDALSLADEYHAEVGAQLARRWSLPSAVSEAIRHHHTITGCDVGCDDARMTTLSDFLARLTLEGETDPERLSAHDAYAELNLYLDDVAALVAKQPTIVEFVETMR